MPSQAVDGAEDVVLDALQAVKVTDAPSARSTPSTPRWRRPNRLIGAIIPLLLVTLFAAGYYVALSEVAPWLELVQRRPVLAFFYRWTCRALFASLAHTFLTIYMLPRGHSRPPREPPKEVVERSIVHECADMQGEVLRCWQDDCNGSWLPARARHCKDCGHCALAFDHCCPWFGPACITGTRTLKPFLLFMTSAVLLIAIGGAPLLLLVCDQVNAVLRTSWSRDIAYVNERWWHRKRSWAFGPVWRYAGGLIHAYRHHATLDLYARHPSLEPSLMALVVLAFIALVLLVGLSMLAISVRHLLAGGTTLEVERTRRGWHYDARRYLWVPLEPPAEGEQRWSGRVVRVEPDAPLYDLGPAANWRTMMGERWWQCINPHYSPLDGVRWRMNEVEVARLKALTRKNL